MLKYGVNSNFELRLITEYLGTTVKRPEVPGTHAAGFSPLALGLKVKLAEEKGFWPQAALIGHIELKSGSHEFKSPNTTTNFRFTFSNTLSDAWSLSYNLGAAWSGENPEATFLYTLSVGYSINKKLAAFAEAYSFFPERSKADNRVDGGFTYKFSPVVQFDVSGGLGLSENAPDYFLSTGLSMRFFK